MVQISAIHGQDSLEGWSKVPVRACRSVVFHTPERE